ncbi:MAG: PAS domain S-box protein [Gammaproteobacteria bacterium]|nr:MAG: PAS domain S-box protein [Gammaproteobacteria bacterium]
MSTTMEPGSPDLRPRAILDAIPDAIVILTPEGNIQGLNRAAESFFGHPIEELAGQEISRLLVSPADGRPWSLPADLPAPGECLGVELEGLHGDGSRFPVELRLKRLEVAGQTLVIAVLRDLTERRQLETQLQQAQKLEAIGQLAAGIAHEINTPIQYVGDNLRALKEYFDDLKRLTEELQACLEAPAEEVGPRREAIRELAAELDLDFVMEDIPAAIEQGLEGIGRVAEIVRAMKDFSHMDSARISTIDLNRALENTLLVARNEYKYVADVETDFAELPAVECHASELNQVFLNLLVNAAHAIADKGPERGRITLRTRPVADGVEIRISDTGTGIPASILDRIFDPFFTTKEVGRGTGQGLAIAYQVIRKHGGRIEVETEEGKGTTFVIRLPLKLPQPENGDG